MTDTSALRPALRTVLENLCTAGTATAATLQGWGATPMDIEHLESHQYIASFNVGGPYNITERGKLAIAQKFPT